MFQVISLRKPPCGRNRFDVLTVGVVPVDVALSLDFAGGPPPLKTRGCVYYLSIRGQPQGESILIVQPKGRALFINRVICLSTM